MPYYNESNKRASMKYMAEKLEEVRFRIRKEEKQDLQATAAASGVSVRRYIIEAVNAKAGREMIGYTGDKAEE